MVEFLRRNWGYKLVSVFLAVLLWMYVSSSLVGAANSMDISLQERGVPSSLIVTSKLPGTVTVKLQGTLSQAEAKNIVAYVDLTAAKPGENTYPVIVDAPPDAKVLNVEPSSVNISVDQLKEKTFPVQVVAQGSSASGYTAGNPVVNPPGVTIFGPETELTKINKVFVSVNLANAVDTIQLNATVRLVDSHGNPIVGPDITRPILAAEPQTVSVIVPVMKNGLASRIVPVDAHYKGSPGVGLAVEDVIPTPNVVTIYGATDKLNSVSAIEAGTVDISGATKDVVTRVRPENLALPAGVSLKPGTTINIVIHLGPAPIERTFKAVPIGIKPNLAPGEQATVTPTALDVTVKGQPSVVNALQASSIALQVDAAGIMPGQQQALTPYLSGTLPAGVSVVSFPQVSVSVN
ncbi:MAG: CdaR family protein [Peptococcaceae bacterium]|nr:CdaR family protein [Peptococcaceae bacterium]